MVIEVEGNMSLFRIIIFLALFCSSYAAKNEYIFCENKGTIIADVDAVISIKEGNTTIELSNIRQNGTSGTCTLNNKRSFEIGFEDDSSLKVIIENKSGTVYLDELKVMTESNVAVFESSKELSKSNEYYMCNHPDTYKLTSQSPGVEISVTFIEIKLQAFGVVNNSFSSGYATCSASGNSTTKPPKTTITTTTKTTTNTPSTTTNKVSTTTKTVSTTTPTKMPSTTSNKLSTTTKTMSTTTSKMPSTTTPKMSTTPLLTTITTPPRTTTSPKGKPAALDIKVNNTVCLLVEFVGTLSFEYNTSKAEKRYNHVIDYNDVQKVEGSCEEETPYVKGILSMGCAVEFHFSKTSKLQSGTRRLLAANFEYSLSKLTVTYDTSKPAGAIYGGVKSESSSPAGVTASSGQIYKCNAPKELLNKGTTTLNVKDFRAGAYSPDQSKANVCPADNPGNNVVPIVVGVILACLVVIIIVAYLIGRRRNREGYQSV